MDKAMCFVQLVSMIRGIRIDVRKQEANQSCAQTTFSHLTPTGGLRIIEKLSPRW